MKTKFTRLALWMAGGVVTMALPSLASAEDLTMVSWGGAYQKSQDEAFVKPFEAKFGAKITEEEYNGEVSKIRAMVQSGTVSWDVVDVDSATVRQACDEGILEQIDYSKVAPKKDFVEGALHECGVPNIVYSTIFAYDADKIKDGPTKIADLFDTKKWPGKRALWKNPFGNLEAALMADGVPANKVYETLRTPAGVDRAFKKLDTIKKDVVWWEAGAQPPQLLASGEVVMAQAWNGRIFDATKNGKNFKIVWDGQLQDWDLWAIPKGSKHLAEAYKFIAFASEPKVIAMQTKYISYGPAVLSAIPNVPADILKDLPTAPENSKNVLVNDAQFWGDNGEELRKRFNTWLAQ